jgi:uncharacterized membrane-anchored protein
MNKVAEVTLLFWVIKICVTMLGETAGDLLSMTLNVGYAASTIILMGVFVITVVLQLAAKGFHPFLYWAVILSTTTAGTTMSDFMDRTVDLGYPAGAAILITILLSILALWRIYVGSLSVDNIKAPKVEAFYWTTILFSNTLGTALGDFLSDSSGLGFAGGALLITGTLAVIVLAHYFSRISKTTLFWAAFVLTRPLGATVGDLLTKTHEQGGLGLGTVGSSAILGAFVVACIVFVASKDKGRRHLVLAEGAGKVINPMQKSMRP